MSRLALFTAVFASACAGADGSPDPAAEVGGVGTTTAFQDGVAPSSSYAGTRDTMIEQAHATTGHGSDKALSASGDTPSDSGDDEVALFRWDLGAAIPAGAIVQAATVIVHVSDKADQTYDVFEARQPWDEATATWKRASTSVNWDSNGADGAADRGDLVGTIRAASTGSFKIALTAAGVAMVQRWVADPSTNHGILIAESGNDNRLELTSREGSSKASRPRLEVTWQPAGTGGGPLASTYAQTCDGSAGIALDATHFVNFSDEDQVLRVYARGGGSQAPVQTLDISSGLGMASGDEADLEDAARIGDRIYATTSHGRDKDGALQATRYRFLALDVSGAVPAIHLTVAGWSDQLVTDLLDAAHWDHPDPAILSALAAATQLSKSTVADLAPEAHGLNIEGLAWYPPGDRLILGLRNPQSAGNAILVTLLNPADVIAGATAHFGEVIALPLGGRGVRGLAWSDALNEMLVIGGPIADAGTVQLFTWSGDPASAPVGVQALTGPAATAAEAVIAYPGSRDLQVLFDDGGLSVGGTTCKKLPAASQTFVDQIIKL